MYFSPILRAFKKKKKFCYSVFRTKYEETLPGFVPLLYQITKSEAQAGWGAESLGHHLCKPFLLKVLGIFPAVF